MKLKDRKIFKIFSKIIIICLMVVFVFGGLSAPRQVKAEWPVIDSVGRAGNAIEFIVGLLWDMEVAFKDWWIIARDKIGAELWRSVFQNALNKIAYDTATWLGSGGKGQKPMFITEGWGEYLGNIGDQAVGEFLEAFSKDMNFNFCEPDLNVKIKIGLGLTEQIRPRDSDCTFKNVLKNWEEEVQNNKNFLSDFQNYFDTGGDIGLAIDLSAEQLRIKEEKLGAARIEAMAGRGWNAVTEPISGKKTSPPGYAADKSLAAQQGYQSFFEKDFGEPFVNAANVFVSQYFYTLFTTKLGEIGKGKAKTTSPYTGDLEGLFTGLANPEDSGTGGVTQAKQNLIELMIPNFETMSDFDVLAKLSICPDPSSAGPTDCVITENLSKAISQNITVGEAMRLGYLTENGRFGFKIEGTNGVFECFNEEPSYQEGYPYRSMLILRKYRILPVGWELAAQYMHDFPDISGSCNLGDMVACFNANDEYVYQSDLCNQRAWCQGLVDPNWVLTVPSHVCRREGPGPNILFYKNAAGVGSQNGKQVINRGTYCADEQSCLYKNREGICEQYGYCVQEKRSWDFGNNSCDPLYNTCEVYRDKEGQSFSYLENTINNAGCTADNAGCQAFCEDYSYDVTDSSMFTVVQNGSTFTLPATYSTPEDGASFYGYNPVISSFTQPLLDPALGENKSIIYVHHNSNTGDFSLGMVHGYPNSRFYPNCESLPNCATLSADCSCTNGNITFTFTEISDDNRVLQADDPGDGGIFTGTQLSAGSVWAWNWAPSANDGGVISMPSDNWMVTMRVNSGYTGIDRWVVVYDGGEIPLDLGSPVTISSVSASGNFTCSGVSGDHLYLDSGAKTCDQEDEGCHEFVRIKSGLGTNLVQNSGFEDSLVGETVSVSGSTGALGNWPVYSGSNPTIATVFGSSVGRAHSGEKSVLIESASGGLYSPDFYTTPANSVFSENFVMEAGKAYTLSAWVYVEAGMARIALGNSAMGTVSATSTKIGEWERLEVTLSNAAILGSTNSDEIYIFGNAPGTRFYVDDIQLEINNSATSYKDYLESNVVYEKLLPDYLGEECYRSGTDYKYISNYPSVCDNYARLCNQSEEGCDLYTSLTDNFSVPAKVNIEDYCDQECVGYDEYLQMETAFSSLRPHYFIPKKGKTCGAGSVGCEEFTNLDKVGGGGEDREYYSYLRQCVKPGSAGANCGEFYTWEGSSETGFQLKVHSLQIDDPSDDSTYPDAAARYPNDPAVINYDYNECNELIYDLNLDYDCREFYNRNGEISYHLYTRTISCSEDCHPFRMTKNNVVKNIGTGANIPWPACQALSRFSDRRDIITNAEYTARGNECVFCKGGGVWDSDVDACIYSAIPAEGEKCSSTQSGCREYSGGGGNVTYEVFKSNFEGDVQSWAGISGTSVVTDSDSLRVNEESMRAQGGSPVVISRQIGTLAQENKSYYLEFIAKSASATRFNSIYLTNGTETALFYAAPPSSSVISGDWRIFKLNLSILNHSVNDTEALTIEADGNFLIDDIRLVEITDRYYVIENSWNTPEACFEDIYGNPVGHLVNLGCDKYKDRNKGIHYLHNFSELCQDSAIGCEALIDTHNYSEYDGMIFNSGVPSGGPSEENIGADSIVYAVYNKDKACKQDKKGCQILGEPYNYGNLAIYKAGYWINDPDSYGESLCRENEVGCAEWTSREGKVYFKDPEDQTCEWRLEGDSNDNNVKDWKWYKTAVNRCDTNGDGVAGLSDMICAGTSDCGLTGVSCSKASDCSNNSVCQNGQCRHACILDKNDYECPVTPNATIGLGGDNGRIYTPMISSDGNNWTGICPASEASCAEYIDPVSDFSVNLVANASFALEAVPPFLPGSTPSPLYHTNWFCANDPTVVCLVNTDCGGSGVCNNHIWKRMGNVYSQAVRLEGNKMYRLAGKNNNPGSVTDITCTSILEFDPDHNNFGSANTRVSLALDPFTAATSDGTERHSKMFYILNDSDCVVTASNIDADGVSDYIEVKQIVIDYQLEIGLDKKTCNGIVNRSEGCVLFNERLIENKSGATITYTSLNYDADTTHFGSAPSICSGINCDSNQIIKVKPDRTCDQWLYCRNLIRPATTGLGPKENVCAAIGVCDKFDPNGDCERFVDVHDGNFTYSPTIPGVAYPGDIANLSGYVKVGYQGTKINNTQMNKQSDDKYNFGFMDPSGYQAAVPNGSFESAVDNACGDKTGASCAPGQDFEGDYEADIAPSKDWGDPDFPSEGWIFSDADKYKIEVVDDPVENQAENICFLADRDKTCKLYAPDGKNYLKLTADNSGPATVVSDSIFVDDEEHYFVSFWVNTQSLSYGQSRVIIRKYDSGGNLLHENTDNYDYRMAWTKRMVNVFTQIGTKYITIELTMIGMSGGGGPQGSVMFDQVGVSETLYVRNDADTLNAYENKECRLYPTENAMSCDYYEDGIRYRGWNGYCLERDRYPGWENTCLQWWSIPHSLDSVNAWCGDQKIGNEEDCECPPDPVTGVVPVECVLSLSTETTGGSQDNSYKCKNCFWSGGWCGDNYVDTKLEIDGGPEEECDWNGDPLHTPLGDYPNLRGLTCSSLPAAYSLMSPPLLDLDSYARRMFTGGRLGCYSGISGTNPAETLPPAVHQCKFDTNPNVGDSNPNWHCTTALDGNLHTAENCIAIGGEIAKEENNGIVVINSGRETVVLDNDFGRTFCRIRGNWPGGSTPVSAASVCNSLPRPNGVRWEAFLTSGIGWTATQGRRVNYTCSTPAPWPPCIPINPEREATSVGHPWSNLDTNVDYRSTHADGCNGEEHCIDGPPGLPDVCNLVCHDYTVQAWPVVTEVGCY